MEAEIQPKGIMFSKYIPLFFDRSEPKLHILYCSFSALSRPNSRH